MKYVEGQGGQNVAIKFVCDGVNMSVMLNSVGNRHYDELMRQVDGGTITIAAQINKNRRDMIQTPEFEGHTFGTD